jgi:hypothetical protein
VLSLHVSFVGDLRKNLDILYHFDRKFTRCYVLRVNLLSSLVHEPKLPLRNFFKFMYREFEQLVKPLLVSQQTMHACIC